MEDIAGAANPLDDIFAQTEASGGQRDQLIEAIYRIALDPNSYDAFMDRWNTYVSNRILARSLDGAADGSEPFIAGLESHFTIANKLLEQTMPLPNAPGDFDPPGQRNTPRFLLDRAGRVVWHNAVAGRQFDLDSQRKLAGIKMDDGARAILERVVADPESARTAVIGLTDIETGEIVHCRVQPILNEGGEAVTLVGHAAMIWPAATAILLREDFGLTPSEIDICEAVAEGRGPSQIAAARSSALATVRTQIKKILAKTGTTSQAELVRLLHLLMRVAEDHRDLPPFPSTGDVQSPPVQVEWGVMQVAVHGPRNGDPIIFIHGMLDGTAVTTRCAHHLEALGLRMICPMRPHFGPSVGDAGPARSAPARFAENIQELIRTYRMDRVVLLGHMAGSVYAHAAASAAPSGQVAGVVNVAGGVPIVSPSQFATMSPRQRLVAYTARYSPRVLPFVIKAGIRQMRTGGERKFLMSLYEKSPHDLPLATDPEIERIILDGFRFSVAQGQRAFEVDSQQVVQDWSALVTGHDAPIHLVHGVHDPVVSIGSIREFAERHGQRVSLDEVPDAGQLLFYKDPLRVLQAARTLFDA